MRRPARNLPDHPSEWPDLERGFRAGQPGSRPATSETGGTAAPGADGLTSPAAAGSAVAVQQGGGAHRAGAEAPGGPVGGQLGLPPAVLPGPELQLLRRGAGVDQALGPDADQPDPGPVEPERVEEGPRGVVELLARRRWGRRGCGCG